MFGFSAPQIPVAEDIGSAPHDPTRSQTKVAADAFPYSAGNYQEPARTKTMSVAVISPSHERREAVLVALAGSAGNHVTEFTSYPFRLDEITGLTEGKYDAVLVELDSDPDQAVELVEIIDTKGASTALVFSQASDPKLLRRCMRAGARAYLTLPFNSEVISSTLSRVAVRRPTVASTARSAGKLHVFMGSKGGTGTTTVACNFAVGLAKDAEQKTLLIDLDLPLGDAALNLGITPEYSTVDALKEVNRMDASFLRQLIVEHDSGLSLLAAPGRYVRYEFNEEAINRLLSVARQEYENVVVDLGSKLEGMGTAAYRDATSVYLVTQASIPELRNSNRIITQFFAAPVPKLEIVINRYEPRMLGVSEEHITKALTKQAQWKIPNDWATVQSKQINATPLVLSDSPISRQIRQMVSAASGKTVSPAKKKGFSFNFFG